MRKLRYFVKVVGCVSSGIMTGLLVPHLEHFSLSLVKVYILEEDALSQLVIQKGCSGLRKMCTFICIYLPLIEISL